MNLFGKMTAALAVALTATAAMAQSGVEQAISDFVGGKGNSRHITASNYQEDQAADSLPTAYYREYEFSVSKKSKPFERLREAFEDGQCKHYKKAMKPAGEKSSATWNVGYGAQSENTVSFGTHKERNYSLLYSRDDSDPKWRTVYGLVWYDDKEDNNAYKGSLHIIYSPDPQKKARKLYGGAFDWDGFNDKMKGLDRLLESLDLSFDDRNITIIRPDSLSNNDGFTVINGGKAYRYDPNEQVNSSDEFLSRFGTLRSLYLDASQAQNSKAYKTSIINKVLSLCKNKAALLSADEKKACAYGIKEMQDRTYAEYDKRLLDIALKALK